MTSQKFMFDIIYENVVGKSYSGKLFNFKASYLALLASRSPDNQTIGCLIDSTIMYHEVLVYFNFQEYTILGAL